MVRIGGLTAGLVAGLAAGLVAGLVAGLMLLVGVAPASWQSSPSNHAKPTDSWIWAGLAPGSDRAVGSLYIFQGHFQGRQRLSFTRQGPHPQPIAHDNQPIVLTYRLDFLPDPAFVASVYRQHRRAWEARGVAVAGIQIDHDSPTARLADYADWLDHLHQTLASVGKPAGGVVSITGLADWLVSGDPTALTELAAKTRFIAFMMYQNDRGFDDPTPYVARLAQVEFGFRLGLLEQQKGNDQFTPARRAVGYQGDILFLLEQP